LYGEAGAVAVDEKNRIRLDDWEMDPEVQRKIIELWPKVETENLLELTSFEKYQEGFLSLFGFGHSSVDYEAEVDPQNPF
jgi:enoyl-[acyl-carrier protein] reductase/trans-2-enoyl-CoA reductase (NAD+)